MKINEKIHDKKILKILHIAPTPFFSDRGCHMRVKGIIEALNKLSTRNILCTYHNGRDIDGIETARIVNIPGYNKVEAGPSAFKYIADVFLFFKVLESIKRFEPDIIHGHLHEGALIGWAAKSCFFWRKIPLVFDMQGSLVGELEAHGYFDKSKLLKKLFLFIEYLITRFPDAFVCSSDESVKILKNIFNVSADNIRLASDGVDIHYVNNKSLTKLQNELDIPNDKPVVIYTGALLEAKGLSSLCKLIKYSKKRELGCHFLIVGYPENKILEFVKANNYEDFCTITGRVPFEKLGNYLGLATAALEPKVEGSGEASGKLLNYMGANLPIVCFNTKNNRQLLGESGYYAEDQTTEGLAVQLELLLKNLNKARQKGELAKKRVNEKFSWKTTADCIYDIYQHCLN